MRRRTITVLVTVTVLASGCGDADDSSPGESDATTTTTTASPATTSVPATTASPATTSAAEAPTTTGEGTGFRPPPVYFGTADADLEFRVVLESGPADDPDFGADLPLLGDAGAATADEVLAIDATGELAYVLGPVELDGSIIAQTQALVLQPDFGWTIALDLTDEGGAAFDALAARVAGEQLAIVTGGVVRSAPAIQGGNFGGTLSITGDFDQAEADELARLIAGAGS
ncbi:MAG: hypothetical protein AAGA99_12075 [Actinomycetota bacterium]